MQPCTSADRTLRQTAARGRTALRSSEVNDVETNDRERSCPPPRPRGPANPWQLVGLLTPKLSRSHAFSPPRQCDGGNGQKRPTSTPGHSGGAVPDSHRSSLFAGCTSVREAGHQSRRESVGVGQGVSNRSRSPGAARRVCHGASVAWQTLPVVGDLRFKRRRSHGPSSQGPPRRCARQSHRHAHGPITAQKKRPRGSSTSTTVADSPHVPRGITVPVGQPGGGSNLKITRVTEWLDRPAAESTWITNLGVTSSRAGRPRR